MIRTRAMIDIETIQKATRGLFADVLGVEILTAEPDRITAALEVREELCTIPGHMPEAH